MRFKFLDTSRFCREDEKQGEIPGFFKISKDKKDKYYIVNNRDRGQRFGTELTDHYVVKQIYKA